MKMKTDSTVGKLKPLMILSTSLIQVTGRYDVVYLDEAPDVTGIPHYVGHPATRALLDAAGAVYTPGKAPPIMEGESFLFCRLDDSRKGEAFTSDRADTSGLVWGRCYRTTSAEFYQQCVEEVKAKGGLKEPVDRGV